MRRLFMETRPKTAAQWHSLGACPQSSCRHESEGAMAGQAPSHRVGLHDSILQACMHM